MNKQNNKQNIIAIDGPSASGKGTVASLVAQKLGWNYLDSGALYRLTALYAKNQGLDWTSHHENQIAQLAENLPIEFKNQIIYLNNQDVTQEIRQEDIGMGASAVATLPLVRQALLQRQRDFYLPNHQKNNQNNQYDKMGLVCDGRDMGAVVFPNACVKVFLTATPQIRAERRAKQLNITNYQSLEFERILSDIMARDEADKRRAIAPLQQLPDAYLLDTSSLTIEEAVQQVLDRYRLVLDYYNKKS